MSISRRRRWEVLDRDSFTCLYCGRSAPSVALEVDHILPRSLGGKDHIDNLATACFDCNRGKRASSAREALGFLEWYDLAKKQADESLDQLMALYAAFEPEIVN